MPEKNRKNVTAGGCHPRRSVQDQAAPAGNDPSCMF